MNTSLQTELLQTIDRLQQAVRELASWNGTDISELIENGLLEEGDL